MKIVFLLPGAGNTPIGGYKVVYEYADGLAARGHKVSVVHTCLMSSTPQPLSKRARAYFLRYVKRRLKNDWRPNAWFKFTSPVHLSWIPFLSPLFVPKADAYVATWWQTAEELAGWKTQAQKLYLIQHYEIWNGDEDRVVATYRQPLKKIVIARWLEELVGRQGQPSFYIPNGLDFTKFGDDVPMQKRARAHVAMLFHGSDWKGSADGLAALKLARARIPELTAEFFGTPPAPADLPDWIGYRRNPPQPELRALYNRAAVFVAPSWFEGWGLTGSEAMMCGTAVVATDIGGHREFCIDGDTALLAPAKSPGALAEKIVELLQDDALRIRIAQRGMQYIQQFTWARALDSFERLANNAWVETHKHHQMTASTR